jgi:hypothetical protein
VEQAVEGSLRRVFPTSLQPIQLAKAGARAMEQAQVIGIDGREVPNRYDLRLAPPDLERFGEYADALARQVGEYLTGYAEERGLQPVAPIQVHLVADQALRVGSVIADARFVDLAPEVRSHVDAAVEGTRRLLLADVAAARASAPPAQQSLVLRDADGQSYPLEPRNGLVRLGRATDNDIVLESPRVSRYHAQLRCVDNSWLVYDLESTNGTYVDGQRLASTRPAALRRGSRLRLGDQDLEVATSGRTRGPR